LLYCSGRPATGRIGLNHNAFRSTIAAGYWIIKVHHPLS
jgi:hypothetical protein